MFTPAVVLVWQGEDDARVVFMPASVCKELTSSKLQIDTLTSGNWPDVKEFQDLVNVFVECDDNRVVNLVFDELGKLPGCVKDSIEFEHGARVLPEVPEGMAIVKWYFRTDDKY